MLNFLILALILSLIIVVLIGIKKQKSTLVNKQLTGINAIIKINNLVQLLQKHRGLSAAFYSGDKQVIHDLKCLDGAIVCVLGVHRPRTLRKRIISLLSRLHFFILSLNYSILKMN